MKEKPDKKPADKKRARDDAPPKDGPRKDSINPLAPPINIEGGS